MPAGFSFPDIVEMWQPLALAPGLNAAARDARNLGVVGRLAPSSSLAAATGDLDLLTRRLSGSFPATNQDVRFLVRGCAMRGPIPPPSC